MSNFNIREGYHLSVDFKKISRLYDGVLISDTAQFILDNYSLIDPSALPKPFCVPGIIVFSKNIMQNIEDFDPIKENEITNKIITPEEIAGAIYPINQLEPHKSVGMVKAGLPVAPDFENIGQ